MSLFLGLLKRGVEGQALLHLSTHLTGFDVPHRGHLEKNCAFADERQGQQHTLQLNP